MTASLHDPTTGHDDISAQDRGMKSNAKPTTVIWRPSISTKLILCIDPVLPACLQDDEIGIRSDGDGGPLRAPLRKGQPVCW